jgi:hypothetical protein
MGNRGFFPEGKAADVRNGGAMLSLPLNAFMELGSIN